MHRTMLHHQRQHQCQHQHQPLPPPTPPTPPTNPFDSVFDDFDEGYVNISKDLRGQQKNLKSAQKSLQKAQEAHHGKMIRQAIDTANTVDNFISKSLLGLTGGVFETMFQGFIKNDVKIIQDTRAIAYEIEGATKNSKSLNKSFEDFGTTVKATGMDRDKFAKEYIDNMKIGIKNAKIAQKITVAQLNTEKQLGMEAGVLKDTFQTMATDLHMNTAEVADMGRGMRDVARFTGLTGEKLKGVIDSSAEFSKNMQKAGNLTAQSYKNIIELGANFKKFGADGSQILTMLSSTNKLLEGNSETFTLLAQSASRVGLTSELLSGSLLKNKKNLQGLYQGMKSIAGQFGIAGNNAEEMRSSLENMDDFTKARMNISLKAAYGMEAGELLNTLEAVGASSETLSDKLDNLNKKKQKNLTLEERAGIVEEERKLKLSKSMEVLASIDKAASSSKDMGEALGKFSKQRSVFEGDLKALGVAWTSETDVARGAITNALDGVNKQLKDAGKAELKISSDEIEKAIKDPTAIRELTARITKAEQEASTASKAQLDPASSAAQSLIEINDTIRNLSQNGLSSIFNSWIGKLLIPLAAIAAGIAFAGSKALTFYEWSKGWFSSKKSVTDAQTEVGKNEQLVQIHTDLRAQGFSLKEIEEMARQARNPGSIYTHDIHLEKILLAIHETIKNCCMGDKGKTPVPQAAGKPDPMAALTQAKPTTAPTTPTPPISKKPQMIGGKTEGEWLELMKQEQSGKTVATAGTSSVLTAMMQANSEQAKADAMSLQTKADAMILQSKTPTPTVAASATAATEKPDAMASLAQAKPAVDPMMAKLSQTASSTEKLLAKSSEVQTSQANEMLKQFAPKPTVDPTNLKPVISESTSEATTDKADQMLKNQALKEKLLAKRAEREGAVVKAPTEALRGGMTEDQMKAIKSGIQPSSDGDKLKEAMIEARKMSDDRVAKGGKAIPENKMEEVGKGLMVKKQTMDLGIDPKLKKGYDKKIKSEIKHEKWLQKQEKQIVKEEKKTIKVETPETEDNIIQKLLKQVEGINPKDLAKLGGIIAALAGGLLILGFGIMFIGSKLVSKLNLDLGKVTETAAIIAAVGAAATAISIGAMELAEQLQSADTQKFIDEFSWKKLFNAAKVIALLGPAMVLFGAVIIALAQLITSKLNLNLATITETAAIVAALGVAATAITIAGMEFVKQIQGPEVKDFIKNFKYEDIIKPIAVLMVVGPAMVLLGATIIKLSQLILSAFNLDPSTIGETAATIAAIAAAVTAIAFGIYGAMKGLKVLGDFVKESAKFIPNMLLGAAALLFVTPVILLLGSVVLQMSQAILGAFNLDSKTAMETGLTVAAILLSVAFIAGAIIGAMYGLAGLGLMVPMIWANIGLILMGAAALLVLTPAVLLLGAAILEMSQLILGGFDLDSKKAMDTGLTVAAVLLSTAFIAGAVIGAMYGLAGLGMMVPMILENIGFILMGAGALLVLTPAVLLLASAILSMSDGIIGGFGLSYDKAIEIGETVGAVLLSAATISAGVLAAAWGLASLGTLIAGFGWGLPVLIGLMVLGGVALLALTPAVLTLGNAILAMSAELTDGFDKAEADKIVEAVDGILFATARISLSIISAAAALSVLGFMAIAAVILSPLLLLGYWALKFLMKPIYLYAEAIANFHKVLSSIIDPSSAKEMGQGIADILGACGIVTDEIMKAKDKLLNIPLYGGFWGWSYNIPKAMWAGIFALEDMMSPVIYFIYTVVDFAKRIGSLIDPKKAAEMGRDVGEVLASCGVVTDEIMKAKDRLVNIPLYGGFWVWSYNIPEAMWDGVFALKKMMEPVIYFIYTVVDFAKRIGRTVDPKKAVQMGRDVAEILSACGSVSDEIMKIKDKLIKIEDSKKYWFLGSRVSKRMEEGNRALRKMMEPTVEYVGLIVEFSKQIGAIVEPKKAAEMGKGVAAVLGASGSVTEEIMKTRDKLKNIDNSKAYWGLGKSVSEQMINGTKALSQLMGPVYGFIKIVVEFSKKIGTMVEPSKAIQMGKGAAEILGACGSVTDEILKSRDRLKDVKDTTWGGWGKNVSEKMKNGAEALKKLIEPIKTFVSVIVEFSKAIGTIINPSQAVSMGKGIASIFTATGQVADDIKKTKDKLISFGDIKSSEKEVKSISQATTSFSKLKPPLIGFMNELVTIAKDLEGKTSVKQSAKLVIVMTNIGKLVQEVVKVVDIMTKQIMPLTDVKIVGDKSTVSRLEESQNSFKGFFSKLADFIKIGIVDEVREKFKKGSELKDASNKLKNMASIIQYVGPVLTQMKTVILPLTSADVVGNQKTMAQNIEASMKTLKEFFGSIATFIMEGIVNPVSEKIGNPKSLSDAARKLAAMAVIITQTGIVLKNLGVVMQTMDPGFFKEGMDLGKIVKYKDQFAEWFGSIAEFINVGIVGGAKKAGNPEELKQAAQQACLISGALRGTAGVLTSLGTVMQFLETKAPWEISPMKKIYQNKELFATYFAAIAAFVRSGIVEPINNVFGNEKDIVKASTIMIALAKTISSVPPVLTNLGTAINMLFTGSDFYGEAPIPKIDKNKEVFGNYFKSISEFIRDGIVNKIREVFADTPPKKITEAATIMRNLEIILTSIPKVIKGMVTSIDLLGEEGDFDDSSIGIIMKNKERFGSYFRQVAAFLRDGVVNPIVTELQDIKAIRNASTILSAMNNIIRTLPQVINGTANGLIPLVECEGLKEAPLPKIMAAKDEFTKYLTQVAIFMRDGIVKPIITELPDVKTIRQAATTLSAMNTIINLIPTIINNLSKSFGLMTPDKCFKDSPIAVLASNVELFSSWFYTVATFMRNGIINPIFEGMITKEEIEMAYLAIDQIAIAMKEVPKFIAKFSVAIYELISSPSFDPSLLSAAVTVGSWFYGIAHAIIDGIINPIKEMPDSVMLEEVNKRLGLVADSIVGVKNVCDKFSQNLTPLLSRGWVSESPIETIDRQAELFKGWWNSITGLLTEGIINPIINNLPSTSVLEDTNKKIIFTSSIISEVGNTLTAFSEKISPLLSKSKMPFGKAPVQTIDSQAELFKGWWNSITVFLNNGIINPIMNNLPNTTELTEALLRIQLITQVMESIQKAMSGLSGTMDFKSVDFGKMSELIKNVNSVGAKDTTYSGSGGSFATSEAKPAASVSVVPPMAESTEDKVKKDKTTSEPSSSVVSSPELANIAKESHEQTVLNQQMVELLTKLVAAMGKSSNVTQTGTGPQPDTSNKKVGNKPLNNPKWPYGGFFQGANKQVGNIGSGTI